MPATVSPVQASPAVQLYGNFQPGLLGSRMVVTEISANWAENLPCNRKPNFYRFRADGWDLARKTQPAQPGQPVSCNRGLNWKTLF